MVVQRIFAEFLAGRGIFAIAERLTADGIPCPSAHDPGRNRHRCGIAWSKSAVRAILMNPRYTGRQVWNRQRKDEVLLDVHDVALGHTTKMRWNEAGKWIYSDQPAHPPIIDAATFSQAQDVLAARGRGPCQHKPHHARRAYAFVGAALLRRLPAADAGPAGSTRPRTTGAGSPPSTPWPTRSTTPATSTCARTPSAPRSTPGSPGCSRPAMCSRPSTSSPPPRTTRSDDIAAEAARARIADAGQRMARYKAAIDAGGDPAEIGRVDQRGQGPARPGRGRDAPGRQQIPPEPASRSRT